MSKKGEKTCSTLICTTKKEISCGTKDEKLAQFTFTVLIHTENSHGPKEEKSLLDTPYQDKS